MKKVAPLALLLGSATAVDNFIYSSTWDAGATPTPATGGDTATNCCYFTGDLTFGAAGSVDTSATNVAYGNAGRCNGYYGGASNAKLIGSLTATTTLLAQTSDNPTTAGNAGLLMTVSKDGATATLTTSAPTGTSLTCKQTLTRKGITAPTGLSGTTTWTPSAGVVSGTATAATCCFLTTDKDLSVTVANSVVKTGNAVTDTSAACLQNTAVGQGGEYAQTLTGTSSITNLLNANADQFTFSTTASPNTITFVPRGVSGCSQTLTRSSSSSAFRVGAISLVGAVVGLIVV